MRLADVRGGTKFARSLGKMKITEGIESAGTLA